ncbi:hypothetical protein ElyMa_000232800 [Elysia marginata]|uniref:Uncharacterized protein n=1 Tax=Elysia marginata TaxID=1093978 RepID=A0AAV4F0Q1_9GAST|nr:hypothetical protein ElyMa_000232800 [Elysia marginata]
MSFVTWEDVEENQFDQWSMLALPAPAWLCNHPRKILKCIGFRHRFSVWKSDEGGCNSNENNGHALILKKLILVVDVIILKAPTTIIIIIIVVVVVVVVEIVVVVVVVVVIVVIIKILKFKDFYINNEKLKVIHVIVIVTIMFRYRNDNDKERKENVNGIE